MVIKTNPPVLTSQGGRAPSFPLEKGVRGIMAFLWVRQQGRHRYLLLRIL